MVVVGRRWSEMVGVQSGLDWLESVLELLVMGAVLELVLDVVGGISAE